MIDCRDKLELKFGRRDLLDTLDDARARVVAGEVEGIMLIELGSEEKGFNQFAAWKDDIQFRWARYVAAVGSVYHDLQADGLEDQTPRHAS